MDLLLLLLLACFFASGFAALLYQTTWTRELSFVFGTSELAVVAVLAAYMGGLALGAALAARFAPRLRRPVLVYGLLELAIAVCALLVPWGIRAVNGLYVGALGGLPVLSDASAGLATAFQLAGAFAVLLPPTALMGATLPLLARHAVHRDDEIAARVGLLYAVNTAGAIAGTVCAAFWLIPELGLRRTELTGVAMNALVFALAALLARRAPLEEPPTPAASAPAARGIPWILPAIAVSGAVSFVYEVMWTRLLAHLLGSSVQAFATMLASFLLGIALGSAIAARLARTQERAAARFALSQLGIALTSYLAFLGSDSLPLLAATLDVGPNRSLAGAALAAAALLPVTLCIGATFPFAVRVLARDASQTARATARVYAWNTLGAIAGALAAGFVLLPRLGFEGTLAAGVAASLALAVLASLASPQRRMALVGACAVAVVGLLLAPPRAPWKLLTAPLGSEDRNGEVVFSAVGRTSTVMLVDWGARFQILTDGLPESYVDVAGSSPEINVAHWLGALPALVHPEARDLLVIGLGGGLALELVPRSYEQIDVIEIEPEVVEANRRIARRRSRDPLADPRVQIHVGDARGSLQLASRRYDAIVSQPSHPWTAGASHLYTREFFSLVRSRLEPDGVFVQWIGITFVDEALLRSLLQALLEVFPHVELFQPQAYGLLFVASAAPLDVLGGAARALQAAPADFARLGLHRLEDFASAFALDEDGVAALARGATPNTDDHNQLAARSARLGDTRLTADGVRALFAPHDPLRGAAGLDRSALVRALVNRRMKERATDVAMAGEGADEEASLGWVELGEGRPVRASRFFERALSIGPGDPGAIAGLVASRKADAIAGTGVPGVDERDIPASTAAVIAGWRHAQAGEWSALAALEPQLASIRPGDPLFVPSARLRIAWRLVDPDAKASREAMELADTLLVRSWDPQDALQRAEAALAAGDAQAARATLRSFARQLSPRVPQSQAFARRALALAGRLSDEDVEWLRAELTRKAGGPAATGAGARARDELRARPAAPGTPR